MNDVEFTREQLRRELNHGLDLLAKASESEDNMDDALAAARIGLGASKACAEYAEAISAVMVDSP